MKQLLYNWTFLFCLLLPLIATKAQAQGSSSCKRAFTIQTQVTASTCMANGTIEVTLDGDLSELETSLTEYALRPIDGTEGTSLQFSRNNILRSVAAGTYVVSVRTFCIGDKNIGVVSESTNVVVGGDYKPLMADFDFLRMRKPYSGCSTGIIAFNIQSGTGYGALTFQMSKAPTGVSTGEIFPNKGATVSGSIQYTLSDLYPAGDYQIDIYDNCSKATVAFSLTETSGFPLINSSYTSFYPVSGSCNVVRWTGGTLTNSENDHYYKYYSAGLYEVALVPKGIAPVESDWVTWNSYYVNLTLPDSYNNYFTTNSLVLYIRLKNCTTYLSGTPTYLRTPSFPTSISGYYCDYYTTSAYLWTDYDGFWCYPVTAQLVDNDSQQILVEETKTSLGGSFFTNYQYQYGKSYSLKLRDTSSQEYTRNLGPLSYNNSVYITSISSYNCNTFNAQLYLSSSNNQCYPINVKIYKQNDSGNYDLYDETTMDTYRKNIEYPYGTYRIDATYNAKNEDGTNYTSSRTSSIASPNPTSLSISGGISTPVSYTGENLGYLQVYANAAMRGGTRITVTDAPDGYRHKGRTFVLPAAYNSSYFYIGNSDVSSTSSPIYMPTGNYTITLQDDCGTSLTVTSYLRTGFEAGNVKYILEEDGCSGGVLKLDTSKAAPYVTLAGTPNASYTNFKIISGPNGGYDAGDKKYNETARIVADGEYVVATIVNINPSYSSYYLKKDTIRFEKSKPILNPSVTSAYVCADPGSVLGYLIFRGQGGKAPYSYELFDDEGNSTGLTATGGDGDRIAFNYGTPGETYIVKIVDACGNSTTQEVTLADLKTQSIIYSIPPEGNYCTGGELKLNCITLGQTTYLWEKKVSEGVYEFVSNEQNPRISNVTEAHSGIYRVTVTPEYCGDPIVGEVTITVFPPLTAGKVSNNEVVCAGALSSVMSCTVTGGKGTRSYQWETSTDQTNWTAVADATSSTYAPIHAKSGIYYYRLVISDDCETVTSDPIKKEVSPCYIIVNPSIKTKL